MSIKVIDYIPCLGCHKRLIGKTEKYLCIQKFEKIEVFEITINWVCLSCCQIQNEHVQIQEVRHS